MVTLASVMSNCPAHPADKQRQVIKNIAESKERKRKHSFWAHIAANLSEYIAPNLFRYFRNKIGGFLLSLEKNESYL